MHKNMHYKNLIIDIFAVTFRKEGVDWNVEQLKEGKLTFSSPSARKVWIEISRLLCHSVCAHRVTFRKEGVDWNIRTMARLERGFWSPSARKVWIEITPSLSAAALTTCHLPQGRCGLKLEALRTSHCSRRHLPQGRCGLKSYCCGVITIPPNVTFRKEGVDWNIHCKTKGRC